MKTNHILALAALLIGVSAAFTSHGTRNDFYPSWKYKTTRLEDQKIRLISANYLAELIIAKEQKIAILDSRNLSAYEEYHIPTAVPYNDTSVLSAIESSDVVVLYGDSNYDYLSGIPKNRQKQLLNLENGIESWYNIVLFPDFGKIRVRNSQDLEKIINRCKYFGGDPLNADLLNISVRSTRFREGC